MELTKSVNVDRIEVLYLPAGYPAIQVRTAVVVMEGDLEISRNFERSTFMPNADISGMSDAVAAIASTVFTDEAKAAYAAAQQEAGE